MTETGIPDQINLTQTERKDGWAVREFALHDNNRAVGLYLASKLDSPAAPEDCQYGKVGYYHCHLPYDLDELIGLAVVTLRYAQSRM